MAKILSVLVLMSVIALNLAQQSDYEDITTQVEKRGEDDFEEEESFTGEDFDLEKRDAPNCGKECNYKYRPYCGFASECEYNCEKRIDPSVRCAKPDHA